MRSPEQTAKIRTLIVDDEPLARSNISLLLQPDPEIEIIGECGSGAEALVAIRSAKPDLVFLDVQMPECDGFDVLEMLGNTPSPVIVFVTAYDQYALQAFEAGALDYILKPFDNARFERALGRAKQRIVHDYDKDENNKEKDKGNPGRIAIKSVGQVVFIRVSDIDWIEAADYYACLHVGSRTHLLRRSMSELEQELDPLVFSRIHRSTIVNLDRVKALKLGEDGEYEVLLDSGVRLRLSQRYRKQLHARLGLRDSSY